MKIYLVGGAVRDQLLGLPIKERDWVVVGSTPETMIKHGYRPVGKAFPVFLHPETNEEYALARTERKTGKGYKGFTFYTDPSVTLEEDLKRRDLTINAIAQADDGTLIDPYNGQAHLQQKLFHHVSAAFAEDPVRILRVARFAAKLPTFTVADKTNQLMQHMVSNGEVDALVPERVWKELERALGETNPNRFFDVLQNCGALTSLFKILEDNRPDINIDGFSAVQRFALLLSQQSLESINTLCKRYGIPNTYRDLAILTCKNLTLYKSLAAPTADALHALIKNTDGLRRTERLSNLLPVLHHITQADHANIITQAITAMQKVDINALKAKGFDGQALGEKIKQVQIETIKNTLSKTG